MEKAIKDRFTFTYESGVSGSFLVASTSINEAIVDFQVTMLKKNPNKYILPLDVRRNNDSINIYYNITSKLSLLQYVKRSKLSKLEFIEIFSGIVKTLLTSKGFLLSDKSFILDEEYIYICPDTKYISLVYLPFKVDVDITKALKDFAMNFVVYNANIEAEDSDVFLQQFISFLKKDTFNILDFDKFLHTLKRNAEPKREFELHGQDSGSQEEQNQLERAKPAKKEKDLGKEKIKVEIPKSKKAKDINLFDAPIPQKGASGDLKGKSDARDKSESIFKVITRSPYITIGCVLQCAIVILILFLLFSGTLDKLGNDKLSTFFALLLIGGAVSYFVWKKVLSLETKENKSTNSTDIPQKVEKPQRPSKPINIPKPKKAADIAPKQVDKAIKQADIVPKQADIAPRQNEEVPTYEKKRVIKERPSLTPDIDSVGEENSEVPAIEKPVLKNINLSETVFLGNVAKKPQLRFSKDGVIVEINIDKPSFIIGRLEGQVDYVETNNAIGKVHAEIITREGCYYIKDLNSKNGTFINGIRIESNKEYEIKDNDRITLANSEYTFVLG